MFVINNQKLPIKIWAQHKDIAIQPGAIEQANNLANHPIGVSISIMQNPQIRRRKSR